MPDSTRRRAGKIHSHGGQRGHTPEDRLLRVELAAYFKAEERGFAPGYEMQDWFEAEREIDQSS